MAGILYKLGHMDCDSRVLFTWVVAVRTVKNISIEKAIYHFMDFNGLKPDVYDNLLNTYNKRAREVREAGINLEVCRTCE
jgi:hypothetical protein